MEVVGEEIGIGRFEDDGNRWEGLRLWMVGDGRKRVGRWVREFRNVGEM